MPIPDHIIARARATPIADVLPRGHKLRRQGRELVGPCVICGGVDRFAVHLVRHLWCCRGCQRGGDVIALVQHLRRVDFNAAVEMLVGPEAKAAHARYSEPADLAARFAALEAHRQELEKADNDDAIAKALPWFHEAGPIDGTLAELYLRLHREMTRLCDLRHVLRFHPRCIFGRDDDGQWLYRPCMLALYRDIATDQPTGVHRFGLNPDGSLIGRKAMGRKRGSCIKLWPDETVTGGLVVGEGCETVLAAAMHVTHRGTLLQPAWSAIDAPGLKAFPVLPGIEFLTVLADHDNPKHKPDGTIWYPGQEAAKACAKRWAKAGVDAEVLTPDRLGSDFNDFIKQIKATTS